MKRSLLLALVVALAVAGLFAYRTGYLRGLAQPVTVAVLDTGADTRIPALQQRLASKPGHNFYDGNDDITDADGHGTKVALIIAQGCGDSGCRLLPIKISKSGIGVTPKALAEAIRFALAAGARVLNVSSGLTKNSPELDAAVAEAAKAGAILVTGAGTGIENPFRPDPLSKIYPQSYPEAIVVGAAKSLEEPDLAMNYGEALDLVVTGQPAEQFGSSFAAATVSGAVAAALRSAPRLEAASTRQWLRACAKAPKGLWASLPLADVVSRLGFGGFDPECFGHSLPGEGSEKLSFRKFWDAAGNFDIEVGAALGLTGVSTDSVCEGYEIKAVALPKGRARVSVTVDAAHKGAAAVDCKLRLHLDFEGGGKGSLVIPLTR